MMVFVTLAFVLYVVIVAEVAAVQTYIQLCREDYRWWWRSFYVGASSGIYLFLLGLCTLPSKSSLSAWLAQVLCLMMFSTTVSMIGGTVAVMASF